MLQLISPLAVSATAHASMLHHAPTVGQDRTGQDILFVLSIVNEQWFESSDDRLGIATQKR